MNKSLENKAEQAPEKFHDLENIILDVRKTLRRDKISPDNPDYERLLNAAIRMTLLKGKFDVFKPGQPSEEGAEWFDKIKEILSAEKTEPNKSAKDWQIASAQRHQWKEEKRAGQTYEESDLE